MGGCGMDMVSFICMDMWMDMVSCLRSMAALVLEGLLVVFHHLAVLLGGHAVEPLLVVLVGGDCALVADVLEGSVQHSLRC